MPHPVARRLVVVVAAAAVVLVAVRAFIGVPFGSDAYSYLVWARDAVDHGRTAHSPYDYTVPKPLELAVATAATAVRAPVALFGLWTAAALVGCAAAAAALARRLHGELAALLALVLTLTLPVVVRGSLAGDSNAPFAACVVAAAAGGAGTPIASSLLALAGLLRPEGWLLALLSAILGWRTAGPRARALAVGAVVVPPLVWIGLDRVLTGDVLYSVHVLDRYLAAVHPPEIGLTGLPADVASRVADLAGWPTAVLGVAALAAGLWRRPADPAVVFPLALAAALVVTVSRGDVTADDLGRMLTALLVLAGVGVGVALAWLGERVGPAAAVAGAGTLVCLALAAGPTLDALRGLDEQAERTAALEGRLGKAARAAAARGVVVTGRGFQSALSFQGDVPRRRIVPSAALGRQVPRSRAAAFLVPAGAPRPGGARGVRIAAANRSWRLYVAAG